MIVVLLVERVEHHKLLVAFKSLLDARDPAFELLLYQTFFFLPAFCHDVQGQTAERDYKTEPDDRNAGAVGHFGKEDVADFQQLLDGMDNHIVQKHRISISVFCG